MPPAARILLLWLAIACAPAPAGAQEAIVRQVMPNGATVILSERPGSGTFAIQLVARGGAFEDPGDRLGRTSLLARMLLRGSIARTAAQQVAQIERTGSTVAPVSGNLAVGLQASGPSTAFDAVLDLVVEAALHPRLEAGDLDREVALERQSLAAALDDPDTELTRTALALLLSGHPLGRVADPNGYLDGLELDEIRRVHAERFVGRRLLLVIVGDVNGPLELSRAGALLSAAPAGAPLETPRRRAEPLSGETRARARRRTSQPELLIAMPTAGVGPEEEATMDLLAQILTGPGERIWSVIREDRGWAYWLAPIDWRYPDAGAFGVRTAVPRARLADTEQVVRGELRRISTARPGEDEVLRARRYLLTSRARAWQRAAARASGLANRELLNRAPFTIEEYAVRLATVQPGAISALARKLLEWSPAAVVTLY